jgi:DNA/RNA-binding domain of Phe-tRNA-synthetase-like protein
MEAFKVCVENTLIFARQSYLMMLTKNVNATKIINKLIHACRETTETKSQNNLDIQIISGDETRRAY